MNRKERKKLKDYILEKKLELINEKIITQKMHQQALATAIETAKAITKNESSK